MSFEFAELYTASVRRLLPLLLRRHLSYSFDYRGPPIAVAEEPVPIQCACSACPARRRARHGLRWCSSARARV